MFDTRWICLAATLVAAGCAQPAADAAGFETGPCLEGDCFDGLQCLSNLCVGDEDAASSGADGGGGPGGGPGGADDDDDGNPGGDDDDDSNPGDDDDDDDDPSGDDDDDDDAMGCDSNPGVVIGESCDPVAQNCGGCAKCSPWGLDGTWTDARCVGLNDQPVPVGGTCITIDTPTSGIDNCELGAMCWDVDASTMMGTCVELCSGSVASPVCSGDGTVCALANSGLLPLCLASCDPLEQDCPSGEGCYPVEGVVACAPTVADDTAPGDACNSINACAAGQACVNGGGGCDPTAGCCGSFCDLSRPHCPVDQTCLEIAGIGVCAAE